MCISTDEVKTGNVKLQINLRFHLDTFQRCENQDALIDN